MYTINNYCLRAAIAGIGETGRDTVEDDALDDE